MGAWGALMVGVIVVPFVNHDGDHWLDSHGGNGDC